ncbi:putative mitochondrial protein [Cucumis melo var. makuwa]|uniref:Putative mitochondrial protein n=1 Tax=Cucumis melo var. makuwa TaxID=1194695 RepID=A0A5D3DDI1_CUCMM|nr:putative mitochondrial protein [Cucumis melo var. makuwa]
MPPLFSFHVLPSFHRPLHSGPLQQPHFHGIGIDQAYNKSRCLSRRDVNSQNYFFWSLTVKMFLEGITNLVFRWGRLFAPPFSDAQERFWRGEDSLQMELLIDTRLDVKNVFLNGDLEEEVYTSPPLGDDIAKNVHLKRKMGDKFEIKGLGNMKYFLGIEVARSKEGDKVQIDKEKYQCLVGKLIYLSHTRLDISYAVSAVSQFMQAPSEEHMEAVNKILRYLKTTPSKGFMFRKTDRRAIEAYTDSDWVGSVIDRKSTSSYCTFVWGNLVIWRSKKQGVVARNNVEAKYMVMSLGICTISIANNPVQHDRTKHVEMDRPFTKERLDNGSICIPYIPSIP